MLPWLCSFCGDIRSDFGKAVDVDGVVGSATDVPPLLWVLGQCNNESNTNNKSVDIVVVKLTTTVI